MSVHVSTLHCIMYMYMCIHVIQQVCMQIFGWGEGRLFGCLHAKHVPNFKIIFNSQEFHGEMVYT